MGRISYLHILPQNITGKMYREWAAKTRFIKSAVELGSYYAQLEFDSDDEMEQYQASWKEFKLSQA